MANNSMSGKIWSLALKETIAEVRLDSIPRFLITIGAPIAALVLSWLYTHNLALSSVCTLGFVSIIALALLVYKLFAIPVRLLTVANSQLESQRLQPPAPLAHDAQLFKSFAALISPADKDALANHDFGSDFIMARFENIRRFYVEWNLPEFEFLNVALNDKFNEVKSAAEEFSIALATNTVPTGATFATVKTSRDRNGITPQTRAEMDELNEKATVAATQINEFTRMALQAGLTVS